MGPLILRAFGLACVVMGGLWVAQGLGYVHWPRESFMLDVRPWAYRGAALAALGLTLLVVARRLARR